MLLFPVLGQSGVLEIATAGSSLEHWLVIYPILFKWYLIRGQIMLEPCADWFPFYLVVPHLGVKLGRFETQAV